jgi:hypothetical protein
MDSLYGILGKLLTPFFGGYVLAGLGVGVAAGILIRLFRRFGWKALIAIGAIIVAAWGMSCIPRPAPVLAQPQPAAPRPPLSRGQAYGDRLQKASPAPVKHKARHRRRYIQYPYY